MSKTECYYAVLGLCKQASAMEIRSAYRKLALKWHPDRCTRNDPLLVGDAKNRFQQIQEAYSVLSDDGKRLLYDAELIDISVEEDANEKVDQEGFSDFMQEMMAMMETSRPKKRHSMEELQVMLGEMMAEDDSFQFNYVNSSNPPQVSCKRTRFGTS